jgi:hypothetical protein
VLIIVEGAKAGEIHTSFAEVHEVAHDIFNACQVCDALYYVVGYLWHIRLVWS